MSIEPAETFLRVREVAAQDLSFLQSVLDRSLGQVDVKVYGMTPDELLQHNRAYVAFLDERPVGCVMATRDEPTVLHCLHVAPEHRCLGHAGALLASAIGQMDEAGPVALWTAVDPERPSSIERWLAMGFQELVIDFATISAPLSEMSVMIRPAYANSNKEPDAVVA